MRIIDFLVTRARYDLRNNLPKALMSDAAATLETLQKFQIVRDSGFVRVIADSAITLWLGRDLDVALLAAGPLYESLPSLNAEQPIEGAQVMNEVARLRISPAAAAQIVTSILIQLELADKVPDGGLEALIGEVREQTEKAREANTQGGML